MHDRSADRDHRAFQAGALRDFSRDTGRATDANNLSINIQSRQGITLGISAKILGLKMDLAGVSMAFRYEDAFKQEPNVGYETLIYDCLIGDVTLFQRVDNIDACRAEVDPALQE